MSQEYRDALERYKRSNPKVSHKSAVQHFKANDWKTVNKVTLRRNINHKISTKSEKPIFRRRSNSRFWGGNGESEEELQKELQKAQEQYAALLKENDELQQVAAKASGDPKAQDTLNAANDRLKRLTDKDDGELPMAELKLSLAREALTTKRNQTANLKPTQSAEGAKAPVAADQSGSVLVKQIPQKPPLHNSTVKTKAVIDTALNQFENNVAERQKAATKERDDAKESAQAFVNIASWMDTKCEAQLQEMQQEIDKLKSSQSDEIIRLTKELTAKSVAWGNQQLVDLGLRWLEEQDRWVPVEDRNQMATNAIYYQHFLGLGHRMVKALVLLASTLRYESRDLNVPQQKQFWGNWNRIIDLQKDKATRPSVTDVEAAFDKLLNPPEVLPELVNDITKASEARDLLLLKKFRADESNIQKELQEGVKFFEQSMWKLLDLSKKQRGEKVDLITHPDDPTAPPEDILKDPAVLAARTSKTERLKEEIKDNNYRLSLMEHLVSSIPLLMWVLFVDVDQLDVDAEKNIQALRTPMTPTTSTSSASISSPQAERSA